MVCCGNCGNPLEAGVVSCGECGTAMAQAEQPKGQIVKTAVVMSDFIKKHEGGKFTDFLTPVLNLIDNGAIYRKGFVLLYGIIAVISLIAPIALLVFLIRSHQTGMPAGMIICAIVVWAIFGFTYWLMFQLWWNRMRKVSTLFGSGGGDFIASPLIADFIKTSGEAVATTIVAAYIPILVLLGIITSLNETWAEVLGYLLSMIGIESTGFVLVVFAVALVIVAFLTILFTKFIAESIMALSAIANNTKNTAKNTTK